MHTTDAGNQIKALRRQARQRIKEATLARKAAQVVPEAKETIVRMKSEAASALAEADNLRTQRGSKICISGRWRKSSIPGRAERNMSIGWPRGGVARRFIMSIWAPAEAR